MITVRFEIWLKKKYPDNTVSSYLFSVAQLLRENKNAENFSYQDVVNYFLRLEKEGLSCAYRIKILSAVKLFYDFLREENYRDDHPCKRYKINDHTLKGIHFDDLLTKEELEELFNRKERYQLLEIKNKTLLSLLVYQGLTGDEITRLKINDVDLDAATIKIKASAKLAARTLELKGSQVMLFIRYINEVRPQLIKVETPILILGKTGLPVTVDSIHAFINSMQDYVPDKLINPRIIRQSVISNWLNEDKIPLSDVQLLAGHRWPSSTEKYIRNNHTEKRKLINKFHPFEKMQFYQKIPL